MDKEKEITLSSDWTSTALYVSLVLTLLMIPVLIYTALNDGVHAGTIVGGVFFIGILGFAVYQFVYTCTARIVGDKLVLKKQFKPAQEYLFHQIGNVSSFRLKSTKYVLVEMEDHDHVVEKYLILNSSSILSFEKKDAEEVLYQLRRQAKTGSL